jgi:hypothetical protein
MADKQTLYELLGLSDKASPADIQHAYAALRLALDAQPDSEEKHNRIAILTDTRDLLLDRRQRAGYDRHQRDRRDGERRQAPTAPPTRWLKPTLASLLIVAAAYAAGRYLAPAASPVEPRTVASAVAPAPTPVDQTARGNRDGDALAADIAAQLPPAATAVAPPAAPSAIATIPPADLTPPAAEAPPASIDADHSPNPPTSIVGGGGLGTGVAIERDKLLTNCHVIAPNVHKGPLLRDQRRHWRVDAITACRLPDHRGRLRRPCPWPQRQADRRMGNAAQLARGAPIYNLGFAKGA